MIIFQLTDDVKIWGNYAADSTEMADCYAASQGARVWNAYEFTGNIKDYPLIVKVDFD